MFLLKLLVSFIVMFWVSYVASTLWLWFLVPLGAPAIGVVTAYAIGLIVRLFVEGGNPLGYADMIATFENGGNEEIGNRIYAGATAIQILIPAFVLTIGWILTHIL